MTLRDAVKPLVIVVDHNPEMKGIKVKRQKAAAAYALAAPEAVLSTFSITYVAGGGTDYWGTPCLDFPSAAKTAFNAGAAIWGNTVASTVPITIKACWSNLGDPNLLGYSGGQYLRRDFSGAPLAGTWYDVSLANSLAGRDMDPSVFDMNITYNSGFTWYYGTDGNTPAGTYDLVTVAAHEIAHGLNFSGSATAATSPASWGYSGYPYIYDRFMQNGGGTPLISYPTPSSALGTLLTSNDLWFSGTNANAANGGRVKIYAPSSWANGSSYSHLDYNTFRGTANSMMVYAIASGASNHNPGPVATGLLKDLGWVTATTVPGPFVLSVESAYPGVGVPITVTPLDNTGQGNGTTSFTRTYSSGTGVTLTAPLTADGNLFGSWSGCTSTSGPSGSVCSVTMDNAKTVTATYNRDLIARPIATVLWSRSDTGQAVIKEVDAGNGVLQKTVWLSSTGVGSGWLATSYTRLDTTTGYALWTNSSTGQAILWTVNPGTGVWTASIGISPPPGVGAGWQASSYEHLDASTGYVLWTNGGTGQSILSKVNPGTGSLTSWAWISSSSGVGAGWLASSYAHVDATTGYLLWSNGGTGQSILWKVTPGGVSGTIPFTSWSNLPALPGWEATSYGAVNATMGYALRSNAASGSADSWIFEPATGQGTGIVPLSAAGPGAGWSATSFAGTWALTGQPGAPVVPPNSTTGAYTVVWSASTLPAATYRLEESTASGFTTALRTVYEGPNLNTPISGRAHGAMYYYRVKALATPDSAWSLGANSCVVNDWPTLNALAPLTINEDAGLQTVNVSGITAGAGESQTLTVTATSSNTGLIPNPAVTYTSPSATGSLAFTPVANANGTSTITVTVNDGQAANNTAVRTFLVTVNAVNDAPGFTKGANQTVLEDAGAQTAAGWATGISAGPADESGQTLNFIVTSNNSLLFAGQPMVAANGTLTYRPAANAYGSATVTVQLYDSGGTANGGVNTSAAQTFTITVTAVNDQPTLDALSPRTINENAGLQTVALSGIYAGGGESQTLTVTATSSNTGLIPNPAVNYTSPNTNGSLSFTPAANASGTATVTVTVNDGQSANNTVVRSFLVTVNAQNDAPTNILLSANVVSDVAPAGTTVGTLSTVDPDSGDTFIYSIVGGDTTMFRIEGNLLKTNQVLDYAVKNPYTVRIRSTDFGLLWTEKNFTVVPPAYVLWTNGGAGQAIRWQVDPVTAALTGWGWISASSGVGAGWQASSYAQGAATDCVLWTNSPTGQAIRWKINPVTLALTGWEWISPTSGVGAGWQASSYARGDATTDYVLWTNGSTGQAIRWKIDPATAALTGWGWISPTSGVGAGWQASSYARGDATTDYVLWTNGGTGQAIRWKIDPLTGAMTGWGWISPTSGVGAGWQASSYACGDATTDYVLWTNGGTGQAIRWLVDPVTGAMTGWGWISPTTGVGGGWQASSH